MAEEQNNRIHLSNTVISRIPDSKLLHYMYEDNDLPGLKEAEWHFEWLDQHAPGRFILVDTGDLIVPPCSSKSDHYGCETYDADYHLYLVPVSVWEQCKDEVLKADKEWRERMSQCQVQKVEAK